MSLASLGNRVATFFSSGYDAVKSSGKRKAASPVMRQEDDELKGQDRLRMLGTTRDLARNFSLVAWAIRKHLDYVSMFDFQMRTDDEYLNVHIETMMREWQRPNNCDAAGRHNFSRMLRLFEAARTRDGDVFALKLQDMKLQAIEGDRIRQPESQESGTWFNGVRINGSGSAAEFAVWDRMPGTSQFKFARNVSANRMIQHGYFERFDQVRGISPLAAAVNSFRDVYEGVDYALAKMKVEQLFALVFFRDATESVAPIMDGGSDDNGYSVDFGKGPVQLDLNAGDKAEFLKSDNPGGNTRDFIETVLGIALKSLDIPFNFYDEAHTNFFGSRAAWLLYDRSCQSKRADVQEFLRKVTLWLFQGWILSGRLPLPDGMTISDLTFEWVHRGMPWWDPAKEINGHVAAVQAGFDNPYRICKETGRGEFEENIDAIAKAKAYAESKGVDLIYAMQPDATAEPVEEPVEPNNSRGRQ